jgi:sporulation protein YlmC with PRC-barrel domain
METSMKPRRMTILALLLSLGLGAHLDANAQPAGGGPGGGAAGAAAGAGAGNAGAGSPGGPGHNQPGAAAQPSTGSNTVRTRDPDTIDKSNDTEAARAQGRDRSNRPDTVNDDWQRTRRMSKVIGAEIRDANGERAGEIEDVVLDRRRRTIAYAVISTGGFAGLGERPVAVPWSRLRSAKAGADHLCLEHRWGAAQGCPELR